MDTTKISGESLVATKMSKEGLVKAMKMSKDDLMGALMNFKEVKSS